MKFDHEEEIVFIIRYKFFEYVLIFFDLCNVFETFLTLINKRFQKYLNNFCTIYLNNILIYNNSKKSILNTLIKCCLNLKKVDLYLNIDKRKFYVITIKYLNFIIIIENIQMNLDKIKVILK